MLLLMLLFSLVILIDVVVDMFIAWDADGDDIRCRWTDPARNECNADDGDICGEPFVDSGRRKSGALLEVSPSPKLKCLI